MGCGLLRQRAGKLNRSGGNLQLRAEHKADSGHRDDCHLFDAKIGKVAPQHADVLIQAVIR
ncbi:hypothetical protein BB778_15150 [Pluralibacter gergoviae]|nr:hypothetical protein BB778_15150 [Pluralibacter gergoviae]